MTPAAPPLLLHMLRAAYIFAVLAWGAAAQRSAPAASPPATAPADRHIMPQYTAEMYLEDSLATADAVVMGRTDGDARALRVERVLWGAVHPSLSGVDGSLRLCASPRWPKAAEGIFILLRTRAGWFCMNPAPAPLAEQQWQQCAAGLRGAEQWEEDADQSALTLRRLADRGGKRVRLSRVVYEHGGEVTVEMFVEGVRVFRRQWDADGQLLSVFRLDDRGDGMSISWHDRHIVSCAWYSAGRLHGVSCEFYRHKPEQLRRETRWRNGVRHGPQRTWSEDGTLSGEVMYEDGFVAPVVRYTGPPPDKPLFTLHKTEMGVFYSAAGSIEGLFRPGMSIEQVMEILKLDFSPAEGILFPFYRPDRYLHIGFAGGRVSNIRTGDNSRCFERR